MTHRQRILADRILAVPAAYLFNGITRVLGILLQRDHTITSSSVNRIIVAKLIGMGSILQATPLLKALKLRYPKAKLTFVTMRSNQELLSRLSCVDEVLVLDDRRLLTMAVTTLRTIATLIRMRADLYFDLEIYSGFASLLALFAVTRNRLGFYRHSTAFKKGIYTHLVYFNTRMPVRRLYLQLGRVAGIPAGQSEITGPIAVHDYERSNVSRFLAEFPGWQAEKPYIVINPNASDLLVERRWPVENVIEAIGSLVSSGSQIVLMGAPNEARFVRRLFEMLAPDVRFHVANTAGLLTIGELLALLEGAACVLTNDTGPMHMAIALGRPTVCLFGPVNPEHYGQELPYVEIFYEQVSCSPCVHEADVPPCGGNNICMQRIKPQAVVAAVQEFASPGFRGRTLQTPGRLICLPILADAPDGKPLGVVERTSSAKAEEQDELYFEDPTVADLPNTFGSQRPGTTNDEDRSAARIWIARAVIVGVAAALACYTWGHWGDFQVDSGRELYVPAEILKGKLLFRDLWYMYGPLAPYMNAFLFRIFGVQLTVLYVFGLTLTTGAALITFEIGRRFGLGPVGSAVPSLFFLSESFYPNLRSFVFPYSYAATLAAFLGLACLYFVIRHASDMRMLHLGLAAVLAGLTVLTKQEFGIACLVLLGFEIAASHWIRRSLPETLRNSALCFAGLLPALAVYGWFVWKLSARFIFFENWIQTPGTYFMRNFAAVHMAEQGFRFVPSELLETGGYTILCLAVWALFATVLMLAIKELGLISRLSIVLCGITVFSPMWIGTISSLLLPWGRGFFITLMSQSIFPNGTFFLVIFFTIHAVWKLAKVPRSGMALQEAGLGIYAALVGLRQMMELRGPIYEMAVFFNAPAFLVFFILLYRIICWASRSLNAKSRNFVVGGMLTGEIVMLFIAFFPNPQMLSTRLVTDNGSFYTRPDVAALFPQIISFMKTHTRNGKDILVLPEPPSLYIFAGMEAPSRMYGLVPGYVAPEQEQEYIDEVASNHVRYVLISNRTTREYHVQDFVQGGYNKSVYEWILANFVRDGQFTLPSEAPGYDDPYIMWVYKRKDLAGKL
jgi:ADP-heptose:LPS heptosyltransferase